MPGIITSDIEDAYISSYSEFIWPRTENKILLNGDVEKAD